MCHSVREASRARIAVAPSAGAQCCAWQHARRPTLAPAAKRWQQCWLRIQLYYDSSASLLRPLDGPRQLSSILLASVLHAASSRVWSSLA